MKNPIVTLSTAFGIVLLASCGAPKAVLTNYHEGIYTYGIAKNIPVDVIVSPRPLTPAKEDETPAKTFTDWPDSVKHIYLKAMIKRTNTPDELVKALQIPITAPEKKKAAPKQTRYDEYKLVFAFSNVKKYFQYEEYVHPGTRLEFLNTSLSIARDSFAYFYTIDKLQNEFDELDMGNLDRTQTVNFNTKFNAEGGLGYGGSQNYTGNTSEKGTSDRNRSNGVFDTNGNQTSSNGTTKGSETNKSATTTTNASTEAKVSASAEADYANDQAIKEAVAVKLTRMKLGYALEEQKLTISQRARINGDISENVFVTANLKFRNLSSNPGLVLVREVHYFDNLFDENNQGVAASKLNFSKRKVSYVSTRAPQVTFSSNFEGEIRAVGNKEDKSGNNIMEYDDNVQYFKFDGTQKTFKLDPAEYQKAVYGIHAKRDGEEVRLWIESPVAMMVELFKDDDPQLFLQWLKNNVAGPDEKQLNATKFTMYFMDLEGRKKTYVVSKNMKPVLKDLAGITGIELKEYFPETPRQER